ncbi:MAG: Eco57I restriction-modification methylase domain-containing protein, partial [Actinobacteria bacterium]|nr:Eco57I restriction-modification methylase domain-containing protein [Actinomycetota bacterium]
NNIFGVDKDSQAVEVTKLSLLLKVLEGAFRDVYEQQQKLWTERVLPDLVNNIKCGNSLIGIDFLDNQNISTLTKDDLFIINPFDWKSEFPQIFPQGFDIIIGNPPWGASFKELEYDYLRKNYSFAQGKNVDSYTIFIEFALSRLKPAGILSYITPDTILRKDDYFFIRKSLLENVKINELIETGPLFPKVRDTWCLIFKIVNEPPNKINILHKKISRFVVSVEDRLEIFNREDWAMRDSFPQSKWKESNNMIIGYFSLKETQNLILKLGKLKRLGEEKKYLISRGEEGSKFNIKKVDKGLFKMIIPENVIGPYTDEGITISDNGLDKIKKEKFYTHPKIWIIRIQKMRWKKRIVCSFDHKKNTAGMKTLQIIVSSTDNEKDLKFLTALLSSKLINFWCINYLSDDMNKSYLEQLPICDISFSNKINLEIYEKILSCIDNSIALSIRRDELKTENDKKIYIQQIENLNEEVDGLIYKLYNLNKEEREIVQKYSNY